MTALSIGARLRSQVDDTELVVIRAPAREVEIRVGGSPVVPHSAEPTPGHEPESDKSAGTQLGKRYVNTSRDLELLVTKPGSGTLEADGVRLVTQTAKALPSSD
jgi:hypothetical protein